MLIIWGLELFRLCQEVVSFLSFVEMNLVLCQTLVWQSNKEVVLSLTSWAMLRVRQAGVVTDMTLRACPSVHNTQHPASGPQQPGGGDNPRIPVPAFPSMASLYYILQLVCGYPQHKRESEWLKSRAEFFLRTNLKVFLWTSEIKWHRKFFT